MEEIKKDNIGLAILDMPSVFGFGQDLDYDPCNEACKYLETIV